jgi:hypothetical protein
MAYPVRGTTLAAEPPEASGEQLDGYLEGGAVDRHERAQELSGLADLFLVIRPS